jgi:uncharacterized protein
MAKMNPVVHFEMPYKDPKKVSEFYSKAFGWEMKLMDAQYGDYVLATTTESDEKGPKNPGAINGGFFKLDEENKPDQYPSVVIEIEDINAAIDKIKESGGEVLGEPWDIPGVGVYVSFHDSEGNRVGLMQPHK